jgi:hypothetical protein
MNHLIDSDPQDPNSDDEKVVDPESYRKEEPKDLKLLEILIDKIIQRLEENSCEPRIQDALKAIQLKQKVAKTSEAEEFFWQEIDAIRREELPKLYPEPIRPNTLEAQILKTILGLKDQVKNGVLPVKTITDTFNQERSRENKLTYQRVGRTLSAIGFSKRRTGSGASAIIWEEEFLSRLSPSQNKDSELHDDSKEIKPSSETSERSETSETSEAKKALNTKLFLCPPSVWSHRH